MADAYADELRLLALTLGLDDELYGADDAYGSCKSTSTSSSSG